MRKLRPNTKSPKKAVIYQEVNTHLQGRRLVLVRVVWSVLAALVLGMSIALIPAYITVLRTICVGSQCDNGRLTPTTVQALQHLHISLDSYVAYEVTLALIVMSVSFIIGAILAWHKSNDWMALLVALSLFLFGNSFITGTYYGSQSQWALPASLLNVCAFTSFFLIFALFPDGRFVPRWTWLLPVGYFVEGILIVTQNAEVLPQTPVFIALGGLLWFGFSGSALFAQVYRYVRVSGPVQRQQTKWIVYSFVIGVLVDFLTWLPTLLFPGFVQPNSVLYGLASQAINTCFALLLPVSIGIAILRYRLYDIDVLINRTLVYGSLTALLILIYFGSVIGLEALLHNFTQNSDPVIVGSTLAIAALFQPLRRNIQKSIDLRFYRSKYDAARTFADFSTTLRNEVDLTQLSEHLISVVNETMQPTHVSLWLRKPTAKQEQTKGVQV